MGGGLPECAGEEVHSDTEQESQLDDSDTRWPHIQQRRQQAAAASFNRGSNVKQWARLQYKGRIRRLGNEIWKAALGIVEKDQQEACRVHASNFRVFWTSVASSPNNRPSR